MRQFTAEEIQEKFERLPKEVQEAITSSEVNATLVKIANNYGLHIDQEGELVDQIGLIMLGLSRSKDFVSNFSSSANVDTKTATSIAEDINKEIFGQIRESMRVIQNTEEAEEQSSNTAISDLEHIGDFTIEHENRSNDSNDEEPLESHDEMIAGIENPESIKAKTPINNSAGANAETMLVDHLLSNPSVTVEQKTVVKRPLIVPKKPLLIVPKKPKGSSGPDPYRELVK